jgi:hypothetical protein
VHHASAARRRIRIRVVQHPGVRLHDVTVAFVGGNARAEGRPLRWEQRRDATSEPPVGLGSTTGRDTPEDDLPDPVRMRLGVGERQRAAPRPAEQQPPLDLELVAEQLHVRDEALRRVRGKIDLRLAGVRRAVTASALIEQHDPVRGRIEHPAVPRRAPRPRSAVDHERRLAVGVPARLP